jgi:hypothetical protein
MVVDQALGPNRKAFNSSDQNVVVCMYDSEIIMYIRDIKRHEKVFSFRLTGIYAFVVLFHMTLLKGFQSGPFNSASEMVRMCRNSWWRNLLYVTNFEFHTDYVDNQASVSFLDATSIRQPTFFLLLSHM